MYQRPSCVDDAELSPLVLCARSWSSIPSTPTSYTVNVGDKLQFSYSAAHNVYLMASESAYDICDFAGATELGGVSHGGGSGSTPNVYEAVATAAGTLYIACQVGSHCSYGQKVEIAVVEPPSPISPPSASPPPSPPPPSPPPTNKDGALVVGVLATIIIIGAIIIIGVIAYQCRRPGSSVSHGKPAVTEDDGGPKLHLHRGSEQSPAIVPVPDGISPGDDEEDEEELSYRRRGDYPDDVQAGLF